jgi:hypothetical protein
MSNELHITTDFYKLQWTLKFTNNQRITDTDICIFVSIFVQICIHSFCRWFQRKKERKKEKQIGTNVRACVFNAVLLAVSLHLEGPVTGQLDQGCPWFSLVPEQMLTWHPNSTCSSANGNIKNFNPNVRLKFVQIQPLSSHAGLTPRHTACFTYRHNVTLALDWTTLFIGDLALQVGRISDETVIHGYGSYTTLTSAWLHYKLQTHHIVREGALQEKERS